MIAPITTMAQFFETFGPLSASIHGLVVSSILISAAMASFFAGHLADRIGRIRAIALGSFVFGLGCALEAGSVKLAMLIAGRLVTGLGEGLYLSGLVV